MTSYSQILRRVNVNMPMRVIGGLYRHRKLVYPENNKSIRPTKDRIREAFFSAVGDLSNKTFLDLYAGCGSIGIEAISRGASKAYFVDNNKESINFVETNLSSLDINNAEVYHCNDINALEQFSNRQIQFDVIYLDPPYELVKYEDILSYIYSNNLIKPNGIVACETNRVIEINPLWNQAIKEYHYGEITVVTLRNIEK